jgi:hypothetical protein
MVASVSGAYPGPRRAAVHPAPANHTRARTASPYMIPAGSEGTSCGSDAGGMATGEAGPLSTATFGATTGAPIESAVR